MISKSLLDLYELDIHQKNSKPDDQKVKTMVKRSTEQKIRSHNVQARNERIEAGAVVTSRRGQKGVARGLGESCQWKAKRQCSKGDNFSFPSRWR